MPVAGMNPIEVANAWGSGVWGLLAFSMQMALVLVLGSALANAPAIKKLIVKLAGVPKKPVGAVAFVTVISAICCFINWGFGLIIGALLAKEVAKKIKGLDYRLIIAAAYSGFVIWHAGISGSIPLGMTALNADGVVDNTAGAVTEIVPTSQTIFSAWNLIMVLAVVVVVAFVNAKMHPDPKDVVSIDPKLLEDAPVKAFVGEYHPEEYLLNPGKPVSVGPYAVSNFVMESRKNQLIALENAKQVILDVAKEFAGISGREYGLFEEYKTEDADYVMVIIGSAAGTAKEAVDELREEGKKVGVLKLRVFRPFPAEEIVEAMKNCKAVAIMDRCESYNGNGGPLGSEITAGLYRTRTYMEAINYTYGLGGRDVRVEDMEQVFADLQTMIDNDDAGETYRYMGIRE